MEQNALAQNPEIRKRKLHDIDFIILYIFLGKIYGDSGILLVISRIKLKKKRDKIFYSASYYY